MKIFNDESCGSSLPPSPLRADLAERFLTAMQEASSAEGEEELERRLRRLRPAPVYAARHQAWSEGMRKAAAYQRYRHSGRYRLHRWGAAAALFVLCASGGVLMMNNRASATVVSGLVCRNIVETHTGDAVQWQDGHTALRSCDVLYEDSFVLDGEEDSTITVRVPVRTQVMIEDEVI